MHKLGNEQLLQKMQQFAIGLHNKDTKCPLFIMDPLSEEIVEGFNVRHEQIEVSGEPIDMLKQHRSFQGEYGIALSLDGQPIMFAGILPLWSEVGELWCLFPEDVADNIRKNPRQFIQILRHYVGLVSQQRIQTIVKEDFKIGIRFIERFGFKSEGLMRKYGPDGHNYYRYAYIKEDK